MKIITVTPNPAVDQTITLDRLVPGTVHRAGSEALNAGGKGVNVSSCLADWGLPSSASGFLGRANAALFEALFAAKGIEDAFLRLDGSTRTNIKIVDENGTTDINLPGVPVGPDDATALLSRLAALPPPELAVLSGSLPPGCPTRFHRDILEHFAARGVPVLLDANGLPLNIALESPSAPHCVKPNRQELSEWAGTDLTGRDDILRASAKLLRRGVKLVVVSLGSDGAFFVESGGAVWAGGRVDRVASTVGAGDAMVAGLAAALAERADLSGTARLATAFSLAKLSLAGPNIPSRETVRALAAGVAVEHIEGKNVSA